MMDILEAVYQEKELTSKALPACPPHREVVLASENKLYFLPVSITEVRSMSVAIMQPETLARVSQGPSDRTTVNPGQPRGQLEGTHLV